MNKQYLRFLFLKWYFIQLCNKSKKRRKLDYIEVHLVDHCNLNCAYCTHFSPLSKPNFCDVSIFEKDIKKLAELTNSDIKDIRLLGGEPLLHPECNKFIEITRKYFPNTIISLVTNGILLNKQNDLFWNTCRENNILIECTKYPIGTNYDKIEQLAKAKKVQFVFAKAPKIKHKIFAHLQLSPKGNINQWNSYIPCFITRKCTFLKNGKIFHCPIAGNIEILNKYFNRNFEITEKDYIDIHKTSHIRDILKYLSHKIPFCRYCDICKCEPRHWKYSEKNIKEWCIE